MVSRLIPSNKLKWSTSQTPFFWSHARNESCTTTLKLHNINKKWSLPAANHAATTTTKTNETSHASTLLELQLSCGAWCCTEKSFLMLHWNLTISFSFFFTVVLPRWVATGHHSFPPSSHLCTVTSPSYLLPVLNTHMLISSPFQHLVFDTTTKMLAHVVSL